MTWMVCDLIHQLPRPFAAWNATYYHHYTCTTQMQSLIDIFTKGGGDDMNLTITTTLRG
jgi:hypothetical protein